MNYNTLLTIISAQYQKLLKENLVGIYIHGSIAFGCFNWDTSDIDFIVVVNTPVTQQLKLKLLEELEKLLINAPKKGFEMSVVLQDYCENFVYPTPYELHFSNSLLQQYLENPLSLCCDGFKMDCDLAAHFTVIRDNGIVVCGKAISNVFGVVPKNNYIDSICLDIKNAKEEISNNPTYIILNLCRVYVYLKEGLILSKKQAGYWALEKLPNQYCDLLTQALNNYCKNERITKSKKQMIDFSTYMLDYIYNNIIST